MIPRTREALIQVLARSFPHAQDIDPATVDAFVDGLMRLHTTAPQPEPDSATTDAEHSLFTLRATHARRTPVTSVFTGVTQTVRVRLPSAGPLEIATAIGTVRGDDHLLDNVEAVRARFGRQLGRSFERVDLITSARSAAIRFAPMALYFGYAREHDPVPSFIVYEPGDAVGKPGALYLGETLATVIEEQAGYKPTPLSSPDHWYTGGIRMAANGRDPAVLFMHAAVERGGEPHFRLHVEYEPAEQRSASLPASDLVEAALRMLAVEHGVGNHLGVIERLVAETGLALLPWIDRPDNGPPPPDHGGVTPPAAFQPTHAFDEFLVALSPAERARFEASIAVLLGAVVRADDELDRLERIEIDSIMNFEVPSALGPEFRSSPAAAAAYRVLLDGGHDPREFDDQLEQLARIVERLPEPLRDRYTSFVVKVCGAAAEASGGWLWFGSTVSVEEKGVLDRIAAALGLGSLA